MFYPYDRYLKQHLTPPRYTHSRRVMRAMEELAAIYDLDREQAMAAGLLHDIAKDIPAATMLALAQQADIERAHPCESHPMYLHGPVGAHLARTELGIEEPLILEAIATHTTHAEASDARRTPFCWCLRFADILEPVKPWPGMRKLKRAVHGGRHEEAQLLLSAWVIEYFEAVGIPVHPNFRRNAASLAARLRVDAAFYQRDENFS